MRAAPASRERATATLRAACALALAAGLLAAVELSPDLARLLEPVNTALARVTEVALGYMHMPVSRHGAVLSHPDGFSYRITYVCSGIRPAVLIVAVLLAMPAGWRLRLAGLFAAFVLLEALNVCRLTHLYWTGVVNPDRFLFAHRVEWNVIFVAAVSGFLAVWLATASEMSRRAAARRRSMHVQT